MINLHIQIYWLYFKIVKVNVLDVQKVRCIKLLEKVFSRLPEFATFLRSYIHPIRPTSEMLHFKRKVH